jgi:hypothetical protein
MTDLFLQAGVEPALDDMLADPIIQAVMRRDGVTSADLRAAIEQVRDRHAAAGRRDRAQAQAGCAGWPLAAEAALA